MWLYCQIMWLYCQIMWLYCQIMWLYCQVMWLYDAPNHMTVSLLTGALPCEKWGQISCCTSTADHQPPHTINVCSPSQHEWPTSGNSDTLPSHLAKTAYSNSFCKGGVNGCFCFASYLTVFRMRQQLPSPSHLSLAHGLKQVCTTASISQSPQFSSWVETDLYSIPFNRKTWKLFC